LASVPTTNAEWATVRSSSSVRVESPQAQMVTADKTAATVDVEYGIAILSM